MSETDRPRSQHSASLDRARTNTPGSSLGGMHSASAAARQDVRGARLLNRNDWIYVLSLLIPFAVFDLALRSRLVFFAPIQPTPAGWIGLMQSPLLFLGGYTALWIAVLASARTRPVRWVLRGLFQALSIVIALYLVGAYQYYRATGTMLDAHYLRFWLSFPDGTTGAIAAELHYSIQALIFAILAYGILGPPLLVFLANLWPAWRNAANASRSALRPWRRIAGVGLLAVALFACALIPGGPVGVSTSFARHAFVNLLVTATQVARGGDDRGVAAGAASGARPVEPRLIPMPTTERRNVVLIFLEFDARIGYHALQSRAPDHAVHERAGAAKPAGGASLRDHRPYTQRAHRVELRHRSAAGPDAYRGAGTSMGRAGAVPATPAADAGIQHGIFHVPYQGL